MLIEEKIEINKMSIERSIIIRCLQKCSYSLNENRNEERNPERNSTSPLKDGLSVKMHVWVGVSSETLVN